MIQSVLTKRNIAALAVALVGALPLSALAQATGASAEAKKYEPPAYLLNNEGCAVVAGGSVGSSFDDAEVARFWHNANRQISDLLIKQLTEARYRVVPLIVPVPADPSDTRRTQELVVVAMARAHCNRLIQVSTDVNEDAKGRYFAFVITQLRMAPKEAVEGGTHTTTVGEYEHSYRYPRTTEAFNSFQIGTFATTVFNDIKASGALAPLAEK